MEKEPTYAFFFSLKIPSKRTPPGPPNSTPTGKAAFLQGLFYISLKFFIKIP